MDDGTGEAVRSALAAAFPDRPVAAVERPDGSDHPGNEVRRVRLDDGTTAYLKAATGDGGAERIARETALMRYVGANAAVRTPTVLAADDAADPPYLATAPLAGTRLVDDLAAEGDGVDVADLTACLDRLGRALAGLHAARLDGAGWVVGGDESRLDLDAAPWPTVLRERVVEDHPVPDRFADVPDRVASLLAGRASDLRLPGGTAVVVHGDCHLQNAFDDDGDLGVLDLESGTVGDPVYDLAFTEDLCVDGRPDLSDAERDRLRAALRDGYRAGARANDLPVAADGLPPGYERRRAVYRVVTFLVTVATFETWAADAEEPVDDLADWVRGEVDRRLSAVRELSDEDRTSPAGDP